MADLLGDVLADDLLLEVRHQVGHLVALLGGLQVAHLLRLLHRRLKHDLAALRRALLHAAVLRRADLPRDLVAPRARLRLLVDRGLKWVHGWSGCRGLGKKLGPRLRECCWQN